LQAALRWDFRPTDRARAMALTLKFLSRAPCIQQVVAASPKILASAVASSPKAPCTPARSPFGSCSSPFFGEIDSVPWLAPAATEPQAHKAPSTPSSAARLRGIAAERRQQVQQLVAKAHPSAESARAHFVARRVRQSGEGATSAEAEAAEEEQITSEKDFLESCEHQLKKLKQMQQDDVSRPCESTGTHKDCGAPTLLGTMRAQAPRDDGPQVTMWRPGSAEAPSEPGLPVVLGRLAAGGSFASLVPFLPTVEGGDVGERPAAELALQAFAERRALMAQRGLASIVP